MLSRNKTIQNQYRSEYIFSPSDVNIGIAVAIDDDLIVPVIKNADRKDLVAISNEASTLIEKAKSKSLKPDDINDATFVVTNLGMFGIISFVPIVNPGQSAILSVGGLQKIPIVTDENIVIGQVIEFTLVCDHRVINGVTAATFCHEFKEVIETERENGW